MRRPYGLLPIVPGLKVNMLDHYADSVLMIKIAPCGKHLYSGNGLSIIPITYEQLPYYGSIFEKKALFS
jgi:hypothetical protein